MAKILLLFSLLVLVSCNAQDPCQTNTQAQESGTAAAACGPGPVPEPDPAPGPDPMPEPEPDEEVPHEALIFDASVKFTNFERDDEEKVFKAIDIIKKVVGSREFREQVVNYTYNGKKQYVDNKGLSNDQIYNMILAGKEELQPEVDHEMDLDLELYYSWRNTVGYTYANTMRIWMNTKYFDYYTPAEVAGNIFHEWLHKIGFDHASSYSTARDSSVPYAIGYIMEELGKQYE